ncbi:alpha/beta hydrolase [Enterococcus sp.]|uniref:alpha/beta hydrolase n=1 Tax=Enterococcus sp. TaxID=35783 RepID=UPI002906AE1E|nr:alpha/beta hydrolase-fold protein [Enterococcus sp.]MDU5333176.1 alpha/beta hydrolase-fold protein [Enterococcus sp.]
MRKNLLFVLLFTMVIIGIGAVFFFNTWNSPNSISSEESVESKNSLKEEMPTNYHNSSINGKGGSVERVSYETDFEEESYQKEALVYLPVDYYDTDKQYNVLYLMHGWDMGPEDFLGNGGKNEQSLWKTMIDNLIADEKVEPMIVVAPTYYPNREMITGNWNDDLPLNQRFAESELISDLMPLIASNYRTFAKGSDQSSLQEARDHQAFGGFSMGSATTWYVFQYSLQYFKFFMPMAGPNYSDTYLMTESVNKNDFDDNDFFISASVGEMDGTRASMEQSISELINEPVFHDQNLTYFETIGGHDEESFVNQSFHSLQYFF